MNYTQIRKNINARIKNIMSNDLTPITLTSVGKAIAPDFFRIEGKNKGTIRTLKEVNNIRKKQGFNEITREVYNMFLDELNSESRLSVQGEIDFRKQSIIKTVETLQELGYIDEDYDIEKIKKMSKDKFLNILKRLSKASEDLSHSKHNKDDYYSNLIQALLEDE